MSNQKSIVMMGATGAVGTEVVKALENRASAMEKLTLLNRSAFIAGTVEFIEDHQVDVHDPESYRHYLTGHSVAICTVGIGQPSKASKEDFIKIDKDLVLKFATACKEAGVKHFQLLASVGVDSTSSSFYLRVKGELEDELRKLDIERLSLFHPSMILTPANRYGVMQGITLAVWPWINPLLIGGLGKFKGVRVERLGAAIANNALVSGAGSEVLEWNDFQRLADD